MGEWFEIDIGLSFIKVGPRGPWVRTAFRPRRRLNQAIAGVFGEKGPKCPQKGAKAVGFSVWAAL
jgi:hypothetical protein